MSGRRQSSRTLAKRLAVEEPAMRIADASLGALLATAVGMAGPVPAPPDDAAAGSTVDTNSVAVPTEPVEPGWGMGLSVYAYSVPDGEDYVQPTVSLDWGRLHVEGRYNYEALDTGSAWVGYGFEGGDRIAWEITPMLGGVFGDLRGVAPGYRGSLAWWKLELYSEGEWVFDIDTPDEGYFYNWSELTLNPTDWFRFGLVTQRTRVYESDREVQRGFLVGFSYRWVDVAAYVFNPEEEDPLVVLAAAVSF